MGRRVVKYLYVDDETGLLVADCEGGSAVIGAVLENGRLPASRAPHFEKFGSPLPDPSPDWEGIIVTHGHPGSKERPGPKTEVLLCVQNSEGVYEWIEIGEST